jgi:hypothetical protein
MKKIIGMLGLLVMGLFFAAAESFDQRGPAMMWRGSGGWGPGTQYSRMYDLKSVETISGEVTSVDRITPAKGMSGGVHMNVKTDKETISVHLGPSWFVEYQDVKFAAKDKVEVKGSKISFAGKPAIIAAEVMKGNDVLKLRDDAGLPVWSGWRRRD